MHNISRYIAAALISVLAFSQIGLNFFHSDHLEHGHIRVAYKFPPKGDEVQKHDEHCKVCSVDFYGKLYTKTALASFSCDFEEETFLIPDGHHATSVSLFVQYRGPPSKG